MKKICSLLCLLMAAFSLSAANYQDDCCYPCDNYCDPCCDVHFSVYADYLYWKVCRSDLDYPFSDPLTEYTNPNFDSGWRIGGRIQRCEWDLGVRYTSFNTKKFIDLSQPISEGSFVDYRVDYDVVDIEVGYSLDFNCHRALLRPFVGAKLAWIDEHFDRLFIDSTDNDESHFNGYGLYVGMEGLFEIYQANYCNTCIPISLLVRGSYAVLDGNFNSKNVAGTSNLIENFFGDECLYVPVVEAFAGLDIGGTECWCVTPHLLIGYEVQGWSSWREFDEEDDIASFGIGGLVVRLNLEY